MAIKTLNEQFVHGIGDIYDAEHRFLDAMQKMLPEATSGDVQSALEKHIEQTKQQIENLTKVFDILGQSAQRVSCDGAAGIVSEGDKLLKETKGVPALTDVAINESCTKVEHYEIAAYRGLIAGAEAMDQDDIVDLLNENLEQEENTAETLEDGLPALLEKAMRTASQSA